MQQSVEKSLTHFIKLCIINIQQVVKQKTVESIAKFLPDLLKETTTYLGKSSNEALKAVSSNNGSIGLIVKIFAQPMIDNYFSKAKASKLKDLGLKTYLEASLVQASKSIEAALDISNEYSIEALIVGFQKSIEGYLDQIDHTDYTLFFQPKYHPIVLAIYSIANTFLREIKVNSVEIENFKKSYFNEIEGQIISVFGKDVYEEHLKAIKHILLLENETKLLNDNLKLSKIGFKDNEYLSYEPTYAEWKSSSSLWLTNNSISWTLAK